MALKETVEKIEAGSAKDKVSRIAKLLEDNGVNIDDIGKIDKVRINEREVATKGKDAYGNDTYIKDTVTSTQLVITPSWDSGPQWPVVQQANPTKITPAKQGVKKNDGWKTAVILPDPQIGYRMFPDGTLDPFHDELAMQVALKIIRATNPDRIVNLGDFLDLPNFGTYEKEPAFAFTTQQTVDRGHAFLAEQRAAAPNAHIELIEGNHDRRIQKMILANAQVAFGIKRANMPESWPVMSVPFLLRLEELGVDYIEGYPAGITWINDNLAAIHGFKVRSGGSTAAAVVDDERVSLIHGHIHRIEEQHKTRRTKDGPKFSLAASPGCLCRVDGAVPSAKSSTDSFGRPVNAVENWQQGVAVVNYEEGNGRFHYQALPIYDGWAFYNDKEYSA